jgi:membrane-bound lytic murein transglycosylase D
MLGLESLYFPMIEQALDRKNLPHELKYLTIVESALNPTAVSRVGATGLWQFMMATGKQYGLEINSLVDERRDPLASTYAACNYLKDLHGIYGDWALALAAYNCGPGNVNKAIRRAGGTTDYWKIYPYLPRETRLYVPLFIAANYVMNYYAHHQLYPVQTNMPLATDTVMVNQAIHFDQIAEVLSMDKELIRALNPQYKRDIVPGNTQSRAIKLPLLQTYAFVEKEQTIANHRKDDFFSNRMYVDNKTAGGATEKITHKVKRGETIGSIGSKYGVSTASIRKWNKLKSNKLKTGSRLTVYADNGGYTAAVSAKTYNPVSEKTSGSITEKIAHPVSSPMTEETSRSSQLESRSAADIAASYMARLNGTKSNLSIADRSSSDRRNTEYEHYKVKSGDSFYSIAKKYPGYSQDDLMKMNGMKSSKLKVGQYIKVPKV